MRIGLGDEVCPRCVRLWQARDPHNLHLSVSQQGQAEGNVGIPHPECSRFHRGELHKSRFPERLDDFMIAGHDRPIKALLWSSSPDTRHEIYSCDAVMEYPHALVSQQPLVGSGADQDPRRACLKACMEAVERCTVFMMPRCAMHWGTSSELSGTQPTESPSDGGTLGWWCETQHLQSGGTRLLRLEQVQWPELCYAGLRPNNNAEVAKDSTGYAVHDNADQAVLGGVSECIERAGLAALWRDGPDFVWRRESYPDQADNLARASEILGYRCVALGYELKGCGYACMVLVSRDIASEGPALIAGAGGGLEPCHALNHAMIEVHSMLQHAMDIWPREADPTLPTVYEHFLF